MVQILDVGCGDRPKGTINVDKDKGETTDLEGYRGKVNPKTTPNFIQAKIPFLPFKNESVDIVLCHHTLEHLDNPEEAIKELLRVTRGQLEIVVPFRYHELIQNWFLPMRRKWMQKHHKWHFDKKMLRNLFKSFNGELQIRYRYKVISVAQNPQHFHLSFKQKILYGLLDTLFPPTPSEIGVIARKAPSSNPFPNPNNSPTT